MSLELSAFPLGFEGGRLEIDGDRWGSEGSPDSVLFSAALGTSMRLPFEVGIFVLCTHG